MSESLPRRRAVVRTRTVVRTRQSKHTKPLIIVGLGAFVLYSVAPVWWLLVASTKNEAALYQSNGLWFSGMNLWQNLSQVFTYDDGIFLRWTANSLLYAGGGSAAGTLIAMAAGYGMARFEFRGRKFAFGLIVVSFLIPTALLTLPLYLIFSKVGLVDTPWAMLIPAAINPFSVYLATVYTQAAVPPELLEAARMDGAGELRIFFSIVLRLMTTGAATVFLLAFVGTWNAFFLPLTMLHSENNWTLALGLYDWSGKRLESGVDLTSLVLTGALLSIIPLALLMIVMQRYWRSGVTLGALK